MASKISAVYSQRKNVLSIKSNYKYLKYRELKSEKIERKCIFTKKRVK